MKNKILLFSLTILCSFYSFAQQGFQSVSEAADIAREIVKASGKQTNFSIKEGNVSNAMAMIMNNKRFVLYNPGFINSITQATGTKWSAVSVLAHEIGHHLYSRVVNGRTVALSTELEADEFSGFILKRLGASLDEAQAAMRVLASERASRTHPARQDRLQSIAKGWESTDNESASFAAVASRINQDAQQDIADQRPNRGTYNNNAIKANNSQANMSYVLANISFDTEPGVTYYLTDKYKVVKIKNSRAYTVGKFSRLSDRNFPFMIADADNNKIFIDSNGRIVDEDGRRIGSFTAREPK